jgi:hypothetical protein
MVVKLIWDSKENWWQSDVYQVWKDWEIAQKVYSSLSLWGKKNLELYVKLQNKLSESNPHIIKLKKSLKLSKEIEVKEIHFSILPLNTELFESTNIKNKTSMFTSEQKFIEWESLSDFLKKNWNLLWDWIHFLHYIPIIIGDFISDFFAINMSNSHYLEDKNLHFHNIKVKNYDEEKWILSLTITDIAQTIPLLIENNRERISEILGTKSISNEKTTS